MKKFVFALLPLIVLLSFYSIDVKGIEQVEADLYRNKAGATISREDLESLTELLPMSKIDTLSQNDVDEIINGTIVSSEQKYYRTIYYNNGTAVETEVTKEEYDNASGEKVCTEYTRGDDSGYFETNYKRLSSNLVELPNKHLLTILLIWKMMPATRSYDVIAFRTRHMSYSNVDGCQTYYINGNYTDINYDSSSAGYKGLSNGAGISMNLKDETTISKLMLALWADLQISSTDYPYAHVFTTYQHAQSSLTRAQSKSYTLQAGGLGDVVYYSDMNIWNKYDDMTGIELIIPTT